MNSKTVVTQHGSPKATNSDATTKYQLLVHNSQLDAGTQF